MSTRRPRYRYIAFRVEGVHPVRRGALAEACRGLTPRLALVSFDGIRGLVRTTHLERDAAVQALTALVSVAGEPVRVTTVGTSGTIRAASEKYLRPKVRGRESQLNNPYK